MNPYEVFLTQLDGAAQVLNLSKHVTRVLREPERVIEVSIPVRMDDGTVQVFKGWRSEHNTALGPAKGGIRYHWDVTRDEVVALSAWMSMKNALLDLPYGGGKGGVRVNPKELSDGELERLSRGFVDRVYKYIGPDQDIPAPDVYTNPKIMAWMMDEYEKLVGKKAPGVITGKPLILGGSKGRGYATAIGGFFVLREALKMNSTSFEGKTAAIQGFGNAGSFMGKFLYENSTKVIAVSDSKGGIYNPNGLPILEVIDHKRRTGSVVNFPNAENITNEELLTMDVDILAPAALEGVVTGKNADQVRAKYIVELANGPVTPEADEILYKKGVFILPDILANAGGVTVSYFEWVQNRMGYYWEESEVVEKLDKKMSKAFKEIYDVMEEYGVNSRKASYIVALRRIVEALKARGVA